MSQQGKIPYGCDCTECGREIEVHLPFADTHSDSTGKYVKCGECGHINHATKIKT